jgi:hypothetical protein
VSLVVFELGVADAKARSLGLDQALSRSAPETAFAAPSSHAEASVGEHAQMRRLEGWSLTKLFKD